MNEIKKSKDILYRVEENWPIEGVNFIDLTPSILTPSYFRAAAQKIKNMILSNNNDIDYIVSPDARGFLWGTYVAALLDKPLIPIRKHGKLPDSCVMSRAVDTTEYSQIELDLPKVNLNGKRCVFVDDVYATGGTYKACQKLISQNNGILEGAYVVLNVLLTKDNVNAILTSNELDLGQKERAKVKSFGCK